MKLHITKNRFRVILREAIEETLDTSYRGYLHGELKNRIKDWNYDIWDDEAQADNLKKLGSRLHRDMSDFDIANGGNDTTLFGEMKKLGFIPLHYQTMGGKSYDGDIMYFLIDKEKFSQVKQKFQSLLNFFNFRCVKMSDYDGQDFGYDIDGIRVALEPYFTQEYETQNRVFYHATPDRNVQKILRQGLVPKDRGQLGAKRPERIYLTQDFDNDIVSELEDKNGMEYTVLKVDLTSQPQIKLYHDPYYEDKGLYVTSYIPPSCISVLNPQPHKQKRQRNAEMQQWFEELASSLGLSYSNRKFEGECNGMEVNLQVNLYPIYGKFQLYLNGYIMKRSANGKGRKISFNYRDGVIFKSTDGHGLCSRFEYDEIKPLIIDTYLKAILTKGTKRFIWN